MSEEPFSQGRCSLRDVMYLSLQYHFFSLLLSVSCLFHSLSEWVNSLAYSLDQLTQTLEILPEIGANSGTADSYPTHQTKILIISHLYLAHSLILVFLITFSLSSLSSSYVFFLLSSFRFSLTHFVLCAPSLCTTTLLGSLGNEWFVSRNQNLNSRLVSWLQNERR